MKKKKNEVWLNLGCGLVLKKDFINVDIAYELKDLKSKKGIFKNAIIEKGAEYIKADIKKLSFKNNYADYVELLNTIEHFPMREIAVYLKEIRRVMKPGAKLLIMTNHFDGIAADWLKMIAAPPFNLGEYMNLTEIIYGNQLAKGEYHTCPFNPSFMNYCLTQVGFKKGVMKLFKKGSPTPKVGIGNPYDKNKVCRNDMIYVKTIK
jgi:SAM-dependent methyltransferase